MGGFAGYCYVMAGIGGIAPHRIAWQGEEHLEIFQEALETSGMNWSDTGRCGQGLVRLASLKTHRPIQGRDGYSLDAPDKLRSYMTYSRRHYQTYITQGRQNISRITSTEKQPATSKEIPSFKETLRLRIHLAMRHCPMQQAANKDTTKLAQLLT